MTVLHYETIRSEFDKLLKCNTFFNDSFVFKKKKWRLLRFVFKLFTHLGNKLARLNALDKTSKFYRDVGLLYVYILLYKNVSNKRFDIMF